MKVIFFVAVVAAFVAITCGNPATVLSKNSSDWKTATTWTEELGDVIQNFVEIINSTAINDNFEVGLTISIELEKAQSEAFTIFVPIIKETFFKNLSVDRAEDYLNEIGVIFPEFMNNVDTSLQQLSSSARDTVLKAYDAASRDGKEAASQLIQALTFFPNWARAYYLRAAIATMFNGAVLGVTLTAIGGDVEIGGEISSLLYEVRLANTKILTKIEGHIRSHTLEPEQLSDDMREMYDNLLTAEEKISPLIDQLPEDAQTTINETIAEATNYIREKVRKLFEAAFGFGPIKNR